MPKQCLGIENIMYRPSICFRFRPGTAAHVNSPLHETREIANKLNFVPDAIPLTHSHTSQTYLDFEVSYTIHQPAHSPPTQ